MTTDSGYERLEDQIAWYDRKSVWNQRRYKVLKIVSIVAAALVPLAAGAGMPAYVPGALGVAVVIVEGLQQMNQHHHYWVQYRMTCARLRREKFLYMARTGPYDTTDEEAYKQLVLHVEALVSDDNMNWTQTRQDSERKEKAEEKPAPAIAG